MQAVTPSLRELENGGSKASEASSGFWSMLSNHDVAVLLGGAGRQGKRSGGGSVVVGKEARLWEFGGDEVEEKTWKRLGDRVDGVS